VADDKKKRIEFYGVESEREGCPVQQWYDNTVNMDGQDEIFNLASHLSALPSGLWRRPDFDPLEGEGGISEVRPKDIRSIDGNFTYRIYGVLGHPDKWSYTFLHGTDKDVKNDRIGKEIAKRRLRELEERRATVHRFNFQGGSGSQTPKKSRREN